MRPRSNYPVQVLAAGFLVLAFLSLSLFWARRLCKSNLANMLALDDRTVQIQPCGLVPPKQEHDPNVASQSSVYAHIIRPEPLQTLGIVNYFHSRMSNDRYCRVFYFHPADEDSSWMYFDKRTGQINCRWPDKEGMPDGSVMQKMVQSYVGPEGVSGTPDRKLGRFSSVVADVSQALFYDRKLRRFFTINLKKETVTKGPQLSSDDLHKPVDIGMLSKNPGVLDLYWLPPIMKWTPSDQEQRPYSNHGAYLTPIRDVDSAHVPYRYVLVLDESGRIDLLDRKTLEFAGTAGRLPSPQTFFHSNKPVTPADLLAYRVLPIALDAAHEYRGLFAASVSREGTSLALSVFNEKGVLVSKQDTKAQDSRGRRNAPSSSAAYFGAPWAPVMTIGKYLLENLHPPILLLASYFTADSIEAGAGHRALFLLPDSFVAMKARGSRGTVVEKFILALLLMSPGLILAVLLAYRVSRDAAAVGLPREARRWWTLGTIAFGLVGYITYRLTRPKITLVTCANCGHPRRPDVDKCHRCGSLWHVPELIPPAWRVLDEFSHEGTKTQTKNS
jgi:hypothetical protein